ncbi:MAG: pyridoxal phosphate-dependent aminotransferase [Candidatus Aenigmarchaeota archaeon]|nr:pyridoxal phosphate-dependent aminotransferase [Candidatus Aenigmarchaeota archaeon]
MLSERAKNCSPSPTLAISARAKALAAQGKNVVDFGAGQPDFDAPEHVKKAAIDAINQGFNKYTAAAGMPKLKKVICDKFRRDNRIDYQPDQVVVSCGAKHSIYNIMQAVIGPGDEVLIPKPYWVTYPEQVKLAGGKPVVIETDENFKLTKEYVEDKITSNSKLILINSPNNPTGAVYDREELKKIAELCLENNILMVSDEVYEKIIFDAEHFSIASMGKEFRNITFTVNAISKTYCVTGWRLGYAAGPAEIMKAIGNLQSHMTSNPTSVVQKAALEAISGPQDFLVPTVKEFRDRRDFILKRMDEIGMECPKPEGAFYVFPKIPSDNSDKFAEELLESERVGVVPGVGFGMEGHVRISYATSLERIKEGMDRIERFLKK